MENTTFTFADLSRFLRRAPRLKTYAIPAAFLLVIDFIIIRDVIFTSLAFLLPLLLVILFDRLFVRLAGFHFPPRRVNYLDFMSFFFSQLYFIILTLAFPWFMNISYDVMLAFATTGLLRSMVFYTYFSDRFRNVLLPSLGYMASAMVGLAFVNSNPYSYPLFLAATLVFSVGGFLFAHISVSGFTNEFGQTPITILNFFLNSRGSKSSENDAREFFKKIYDRETEVPVQVVDILDSSGRRKVMLVFPYIHPGPFGNIGTSNIPFKLQERLAEFNSDLMVFHTTTTNSNNSATEEDIDGIADAVRRAVANIEYVNSLSRFKRLSVGKYALGLLRFGNYGIAAMIPERERFDDVSLSEGLRLIDEMKKSGAADFIAVDAQTHFLQGAKALDNCDKLISAARREFQRLQPREGPRIGYASVSIEAQALGPLGIQCLVIESESRLQALVLTDSNNITDELIEMAASKTGDLVQEIEFFTTDNHYINAGTLDMNPLGQRDDPELISAAITDCVKKALETVEDCRIGMGTSTTKVSMGEESTFQRLLDSVRLALRKARYMITATISISIGSTVLLFYFFFYIMGII